MTVALFFDSVKLQSVVGKRRAFAELKARQCARLATPPRAKVRGRVCDLPHTAQIRAGEWLYHPICGLA
jgi:hypothetical protein